MAEKSHASSRSKAVLGGKGKSKSKGGKSHKPHEIHIRAGKSGGHIVRHTYKPDADTGEMPEEEEHVLPDQASMLQHVADNTDNNPAPQPTPEPAAPAPAAAGPAPAGPQAPPPGM
jgi:hypothetical protein